LYVRNKVTVTTQLCACATRVSFDTCGICKQFDTCGICKQDERGCSGIKEIDLGAKSGRQGILGLIAIFPFSDPRISCGMVQWNWNYKQPAFELATAVPTKIDDSTLQKWHELKQNQKSTDNCYP